MPRPHIEFVQSQALPWQPFVARERAATAIRLLSEDPQTGACSAILRYPRGATSIAGCFDYDEEFYVLDGSVTIAGTEFFAGDYGRLPAGCMRGERAGEDGARLLCFTAGPPDAAAAGPGQAMSPLRIATREVEFGSATDATVASARVSRLLLRPDNAIGERSWLLRVTAGAAEPFVLDGVERHPCAEELYVLEGSLAMPCGVLRPGAYFWRPPMIPHGPTGIRENFLGLFRASEGAFETEWSPAQRPIDWNAPYAPVLPPGYPLAAADGD